MILKITLFLAYNFIQSEKMNQQKGGITRSTKDKKAETVRRYRDAMIFWEEIAQVDRDATLAAIRSYLLEMIANQ